MSDSLATEPTRRLLTPRQADTVHRLTEAGVEEVGRSGYENLSIRDVARRAGVAAATAYTYFASKDHLLTEIFWRRLSALPPVDPARGTARQCVIAVLRELALLVSGEPGLAAGLHGGDVRQRARCPSAPPLHRREDPPAHRGRRRPGTPAASLLELAYFGAMVEAGLGYTTYEHMADRLAEAAELIMG